MRWGVCRVLLALDELAVARGAPIGFPLIPGIAVTPHKFLKATAVARRSQSDAIKSEHLRVRDSVPDRMIGQQTSVRVIDGYFSPPVRLQAVVKPPSTECVVPVAYLESSESKKQTRPATSSGVP
jgi:hypothetical protein